VIPRHSPRALSSLTYIHFYTRYIEVPTRLFPSIQFVTCTPLSLSAACGSLWRRLRQPTTHIDSSIDIRGPMSWGLAGFRRAGRRRLPKEIGLMFSGRHEVCHQGMVSYSIARTGFTMYRQCCGFRLRFVLVAEAFYCRASLPATCGGLVEPRRLELLTPSLQRRCSPN
jgi:hypothetical protein